ncbi:MAG: MoaD/ThiS family protein [Bacillota bacterium]|jgi:sulfur carrier protein ThiS
MTPEPEGGKQTVRVKAIGYLAVHLPDGGPVDLSVPVGGSPTAGEVMRLVGIPEDEVFLVIVNGRRVRREHRLVPGDEVVFVPPVAGG